MTAIRTFRAHASHVPGHRIVTESGAEAAAVAFVEHLAALPDEADITVIVRDVDSGHDHCFRIDLETGAAAPCP